MVLSFLSLVLLMPGCNITFLSSQLLDFFKSVNREVLFEKSPTLRLNVERVTIFFTMVFVDLELLSDLLLRVEVRLLKVLPGEGV